MLAAAEPPSEYRVNERGVALGHPEGQLTDPLTAEGHFDGPTAAVLALADHTEAELGDDLPRRSLRGEMPSQPSLMPLLLKAPVREFQRAVRRLCSPGSLAG